MIDLHTPVRPEEVEKLKPGDMITISGNIYTGRDAALPGIVRMAEDGSMNDSGITLEGSVVFHTAVSPAGVGPTSSNKLEIEGSMPGLSKAGVRIHLGKGKISSATIEELKKSGSVFAVIPPVTALLESKICNREVIAFKEEGMEAFHQLCVDKFPAIVAAVHGRSIYEQNSR